MTVQNWTLLTAAQLDVLTQISPDLAFYAIEVTKDDLDLDVAEDLRPMAGKFVVPEQVLDGLLVREEFDPAQREIVIVPDPAARLYLVAATGEWHTLVADSAALF